MTVSTFYYMESGTGFTTPNELDLGNALATLSNTRSLYVDASNCLSADLTCNGTKIQCLTTPTRSPLVTTSFTGPATGPAIHEPTTVAIVMARQTAVKGQAGRGRVMLPGVPTAWITSSTVTLAGGITILNQLATSMLASAVGTKTYLPCLWSRGIKGNKVVGVSQLTAVTLRKVLGTVRRRRLGRGK